MFTAVASITIDRAPDVVFAVLADPSTWPAWVADMKRVEAPSPMKAGDPFREVTVFRGDDRAARGEVVTVEPPRLLVIRLLEVFSGPDVLPTRRFELAPAGAGTRVTWTNEVEVRGLARALRPVLPAMFRGKMNGYLEALKSVVERR
jgi:uncharacterized protein YndB with AHSA1/START domain